MKLSPFPQALFLFALAAILIGCAKEKEDLSQVQPVQEPAIYKIPVEDLRTGQILAKNAQIQCEPGAECSPSVGLLGIAVDDKDAGQCSASLIGDDLVVTNSHCVPDDIKKVGASCEKRLWLHFVPDSRYESQLECEKVLAVSLPKGSTKNPDYAVLKMKQKSARPVFSYSRKGFENNELVKLHRVNPTRVEGKMAGNLGTTHCKAKYDSSVVERFFDPLALVSLFVDCRVIQGNSGGPIQAQDGTIRGVIFAFLDQDFIRERAARTPFTLLDDSIEHLNLGSNFACLDDDFFGKAPLVCAQEAERWNQKRRLIGAQLDGAVKDEFYREISSPDQSSPLQQMVLFRPVFERFGEPTQIMGAGTEVRAVPSCVKRELQAPTKTFVKLPKNWIIVEKFNSYMERSVKLQAEGDVSIIRYTLSPQKDGSYLLVNDDSNEETRLALCAN